MKIFFVLFLAVLGILVKIFAIDCPKETKIIKNQTFEWPKTKVYKTSTIVLSHPICFHSDDEIFYRSCDLTGKWSPSIISDCEFYKQQYGRCTNGYEEVKIKNNYFLCVKVLKLKSFNSRSCYGSNKSFLSLNSKEILVVLEFLVKIKNVTEFWLPAKRFDGSLSPIVWHLPGSLWGNILEGDYDETIYGDCIAVFVIRNKYKIQIVECEKMFYTVCIDSDIHLKQLACPETYKANKFKPNICYNLKNNNINTSLSYNIFNNMRKDNIFSIIFKSFDLKQTDLCLVQRIKFNEYTQNLVTNANGDIFSAKYYDYILGSIILESKLEIKMFLSSSINNKNIILTVYNRNFIWRETDSSNDYGIKCFTNGGNEFIQQIEIKDIIWEDYNLKKTIFELKIHNSDYGQYWCEAHSIFNFQLIKSSKMITGKKFNGHTFAIFYNLTCLHENCARIYENLPYYTKHIEKDLNKYKNDKKSINSLIINNIKIMKIESIISKNQIKVIAHITASLGNKQRRHSEYYEENQLNYAQSIQILLFNVLNLINSNEKNLPNSTEICFPEQMIYLKKHWEYTNLGTSGTTKELCLVSSGLPITRKCIGDFIYGATWDKAPSIFSCITKAVQQINTNQLYKIDHINLAKENLLNVFDNLKVIINETKSLIPADIYFLGRIMQKISKETQTKFDHTQSTDDLFKNIIKATNILYNYLMNVDRHVIKPSVQLNSTNILLEAFENIINRLSKKAIVEDQNNTKTSDNNGVILQITKNLITFFIDPSISNISGVILYQYNNITNNLNDLKYRFIYLNESIDNLIHETDIEIATYFPKTLLDRLDEIQLNINMTTQQKPLIIIKIYNNDNLFQEGTDFTNRMVASKIISISLPGYNSELPELLPLLIRRQKNLIKNSTNLNNCHYWNYSKWSDDGIELLNITNSNSNIIICGCTHLTPFAYLVGGLYNFSVPSDIVLITKLHQEALDMITLLGCSLSLIGIFGIFITAIIFQSWREKPTTKVLLQLSTAIALQMILFCFVNTEVLTMHLIENQIYSSCIALGAILHYFVLVQFSWMLIIAYLQFKRYVQILGNSRPTRFFFKAFILGWGIPLIPVFTVLLTDMDGYLPVEENDDESKICYPTGYSLYFGVMLPIVFIIFSNLIIFILIIYRIFHGPDGKLRQLEKRMALSQLRLSILLFFLLGFTWIFGLLSAMKTGLVFSYLFCLTATLQGLVIFIYFIILDPSTRKMWSKYIKRVL